MKSIPAQEIKRLGISAVDKALPAGAGACRQKQSPTVRRVDRGGLRSGGEERAFMRALWSRDWPTWTPVARSLSGRSEAKARFGLGIGTWPSPGSASPSPRSATWRASRHGTPQKGCRRSVTDCRRGLPTRGRPRRPPRPRADVRRSANPSARTDPPALPDRLSSGPAVHPHRGVARRTGGRGGGTAGRRTPPVQTSHADRRSAVL